MSIEATRAHFDAVTARHLAEPLLGRYRIHLLSLPDWNSEFTAVTDEVFPGDRYLDLNRAWTEAQRARFTELNAVFGEPLAHNVVLADETGRAVAWARGMQDLRATYYMAITAVHPDARGQGLYSAWLKRLLPLVEELGFREVQSRHQADNNAVLIPKLKAGFHIAGFEMAPNYGFLVHLRYNFSEAMRAVYAWRIDGRVGGPALRQAGILKDDGS